MLSITVYQMEHADKKCSLPRNVLRVTASVLAVDGQANQQTGKETNRQTDISPKQYIPKGYSIWRHTLCKPILHVTLQRTLTVTTNKIRHYACALVAEFLSFACISHGRMTKVRPIAFTSWKKNVHFYSEFHTDRLYKCYKNAIRRQRVTGERIVRLLVRREFEPCQE